MKNATIDGMPAFEYYAKQASNHQIEAVVIGAPSPNNHISQSELEQLNKILSHETLVLVPYRCTRRRLEASSRYFRQALHDQRRTFYHLRRKPELAAESLHKRCLTA